METDQGLDLVYKTSKWQRYLYKEQRVEQPKLQQNEEDGQERGDRFGDFQREVFGRLYSSRTKKLDEPAANSDWAQKLHEMASQLPEFEQLSTHCAGDEMLSGMATAAIGRTLIATMKPRESGEDIEGLRRKVEVLQDFVQQGIPVGDRLEKAEGELAEAVAEAKAMAEGMDESALRSALRAACKEARQEAQDLDNAIQALSYGSDAGTPQLQGNKEERKKLADRLQRSPQLRKIARMAGRLRRIALNKQRAKCEHAKDAVTDIEIGADIDRLLPTEAINLVLGGEQEALFFARFTDRQLLQYRLSGKEEEGQGPIVVLIDESGSMRGNSDAWAKATALGMLEIARRQKRDFVVVHFGGDVGRVDTFHAKDQVSTDDLLTTLDTFHGGGTNFAKPLQVAKGRIDGAHEDRAFRKADILLITDGCCDVDSRFVADFNGWKAERGVSLITVLCNPQSYEYGNVSEITDHNFLIHEIVTSDVVENKFHEIAYTV